MVWIRLTGIWLGLVLVVFLRSRLCLLLETAIDLFEIAPTISNGIDRLLKGNMRRRPRDTARHSSS